MYQIPLILYAGILLKRSRVVLLVEANVVVTMLKSTKLLQYYVEHKALAHPAAAAANATNG